MAVDEASYRRPKGYTTWRPQRKTQVILEQVTEIFEMYQDNLPLTARQVFYRLVGAYGYDKTELAYNRLCEYLVRARRSGLIPFDHIRDDGTRAHQASGFSGIEDFWDRVEAASTAYRRDRQVDQAVSIEVWCEAQGMLPQLARVTQAYSVPVYSTGGFSSVTVTHEIAQRVVRRDRPTVFLHIGDFDPSGQSIYEAMSEDVWTFVTQLHASKEDELSYAHPDSAFQYERIALLEEQVEEYDLPTAPPKASDTRSARWVGDTCQAEAMAPDDLAGILRAAILKHLDVEMYEDLLDTEAQERSDVIDQVQSVRGYLNE